MDDDLTTDATLAAAGKSADSIGQPGISPNFYVKLTPKGVVFSFSLFFVSVFFSFQQTAYLGKFISPGKRPKVSRLPLM